MNRRSPRVVSSPRMPWRGPPPGLAHSQTVMPISSSRMTPKKAAVCQVHAIHVRSMINLPRLPLDTAQRKSLGDVVAHEIDDDRAWYDGEHAGGGEQSKLVSGRAGRARHHRRDGL